MIALSCDIKILPVCSLD